MPIVQVSLMEGRDPVVLRELIAEVTRAVADTLGAPPERVRVLVQEVPPHLWGVGGVAQAERA